MLRRRLDRIRRSFASQSELARAAAAPRARRRRGDRLRDQLVITRQRGASGARAPPVACGATICSCRAARRAISPDRRLRLRRAVPAPRPRISISPRTRSIGASAGQGRSGGLRARNSSAPSSRSCSSRLRLSPRRRAGELRGRAASISRSSGATSLFVSAAPCARRRWRLAAAPYAAAEVGPARWPSARLCAAARAGRAMMQHAAISCAAPARPLGDQHAGFDPAARRLRSGGSANGRSSPRAAAGRGCRAGSARHRRAGRHRARPATRRGGLTTTNGTGFSVCAVCGSPVSGSRIISALPWSAVMTRVPPAPRPPRDSRPRQASTVSTALIAAGDVAGVADHVGIGVVQHDDVEAAGADRRRPPCR